MKNEVYEKIYLKGCENRHKFRDLSDYIVTQYVSYTSDANKIVIADVSAVDMAIGAELMKNKVLIKGIIIGAVTALAIIKIQKQFIKNEEA